MYTKSQNVEAYRPEVVPPWCGKVVVSDGTIEGTVAGLALNALVGLCVLPKGCVPLDFLLNVDDLDTGANLAVSVGVLNSTEDDLVASTNFITTSNVGQAGGYVKATAIPDALAAPSTSNRVIALKVTTGGVAAVYATATVTSDETNVSDADTVTINGKAYTFKTILSPTEGEVLIGSTAAETLDNLKLAVNRTDPTTNNGVKYQVAAAHTTVEATTNTDTVQTLQALAVGAGGNAYTLAKSADHLSVPVAEFDGGVTAVPLQAGTIRGILTYRSEEYSV